MLVHLKPIQIKPVEFTQSYMSDGMGWMVIIGQRSSEITFGANDAVSYDNLQNKLYTGRCR